MDPPDIEGPMPIFGNSDEGRGRGVGGSGPMETTTFIHVSRRTSRFSVQLNFSDKQLVLRDSLV